MNGWDLLRQSDAVGASVALVLLAMSIGSWVVILWKAWLLLRAHGDVARSIGAFWQAANLEEGLRGLRHFDREGLVSPLVESTQVTTAGTLAGTDAGKYAASILPCMHKYGACSIYLHARI